MFKNVSFFGVVNQQTGYGLHATNFVKELNNIIPVKLNEDCGEVSISMMDSVSAQEVTHRRPGISILYNIWESTRQPDKFIENLNHYDQLWVPSEWQRQCSIEQGIDPDFVKVVPEGIDPSIFKPANIVKAIKNYPDILPNTFDFLIVGKWEDRKYTMEMIAAFLDVFEGNDNVRLFVKADNPFALDGLTTTEKKLMAAGIADPRVIPVHFETPDDHIRRLQSANVYLSCSRAEGWNLPLCFPAETKVITPYGHRNIDGIKEGELVFTHTGEDHKVITTMKRKYGGDISEIFIYGDYEPIKCTPEHPIFVIKRPGRRYKKTRFFDVENITPEWISAKDISIGDLIVRSIPYSCFGEKIVDLSSQDKRLKKDTHHVWYSTGFNGKGEQCKYNRYVYLNDLSYLFGWYIAEGCSNCGAGINFSLHAKEEETAHEILRQFLLFFNAKGSYSIKDNKLHIRISSTILSKFFTEQCGDGAENKKIPNELLYGDTKCLTDLIIAYVNGDGHKSKNHISISTVSEVLARQILVAVARIGYRPNIRNCGRRNGNFNQYIVEWNSNNKNNIHSNKSWQSKYGIAYLVKETKIVPYHGFVYNLEVEKDNSYLLSAASVHNCEAMACGIPSIALDYSGSTEFAKDALLVKTAGMTKPTNVNGFPDCPGEWAEPDYDDLKRVIKDAYNNYHSRKEKALETSAYIRKNLSWKKAAIKAYDLLCDLHSRSGESEAMPPQLDTVHQLCSQFATDLSKIGYEIGTLDLKQRNDIFVVGCWPNSQERMDTLVETISQIKSAGYPVLISSHYALPAPVIELADYYLYDKQNILSDESFHPVYSRINQNGEREQKESNSRRHDVACLAAMRNAIDFCRGKYNRLHYIEFDIEVDIQEWVSKVIASQKPLAFIEYEKTGLRTDIFSGVVSVLDSCIPRITSWKQYLEHGCIQKRDQFSPLEMWLRDHMESVSVMGDVGLIECDVHNRYDQVDREIWADDVFQYHFVDGPYLYINGISNREYAVTFSNPIDGEQYSLQQKCGMYSRPGKKYYRDWEIVAKHNGEEKYRVKMDLKGKRVLISMGSKALGDTLAWMPFIEEFRKKHQCHVIASTWWNDIFDYPEIEFVPVGSRVEDLYASYELGCYDNDRNRNPEDWRTVTLQKVASDILGLEYKEIRPKLKVPQIAKENKYICFSEHSTMQAKLWNRDGAWQEVVDYIGSKGLGVISISKEPSALDNVTKSNNQTIEQTIAALSGCEFYIGLGHGPSWLAWALGVPVILISGFSELWAEFFTPYRVINKDVCNGCFNDTSVKFDRGWEWCPRNKNYECTREISPEQVTDMIDTLIDLQNC